MISVTFKLEKMSSKNNVFNESNNNNVANVKIEKK